MLHNEKEEKLEKILWGPKELFQPFKMTLSLVFWSWSAFGINLDK